MKVDLNSQGHMTMLATMAINSKIFITLFLQNRKTYDFETLPEALYNHDLSVRRYERVPTIYVLSKNIKNIKCFLVKLNFYSYKNLCILHGRAFVMAHLTIKMTPGLFE